MTVPIWPESLPQYFSTNSYEEQGEEGVVRSEPSIGPAKTRLRTTAAVWTMSGEMQMTLTQKEVFDLFVRNDIARRSRAFRFPHQYRSELLLVRMPSPPKTGRVGALLSVSFELEVLP